MDTVLRLFELPNFFNPQGFASGIKFDNEVARPRARRLTATPGRPHV